MFFIFSKFVFFFWSYCKISTLKLVMSCHYDRLSTDFCHRSNRQDASKTQSRLLHLIILIYIYIYILVLHSIIWVSNSRITENPQLMRLSRNTNFLQKHPQNDKKNISIVNTYQLKRILWDVHTGYINFHKNKFRCRFTQQGVRNTCSYFDFCIRSCNSGYETFSNVFN